MKNQIEEKALQKFGELMVEKIKAIQTDWKKPWFAEGSIQWPKNIDGREYNGMNAFALIALCEKMEWKLPYFCTFDRAISLNYKKSASGERTPLTDAKGEKLEFVSVKKGEKAFPVFITSFTVINEETGQKIKYDDYKQMSIGEQQKYKVYPKTGVYYVFNIAQTNIQEARPELYAKLEAESHPAANIVRNGDKFSFPAMDNIINYNKWVCPIRPVSEDSCYYSPANDKIVMVKKQNFFDGESFYSTLWHEMAHSTGHSSRLDRLPQAKFGSPEYAREELVAELTAALTAQRYGLKKCLKEESAAYLKSWLEAISEKPEFIKTVLHDVKRATSMITKVVDDEIEHSTDTEASTLKQYTELKAKHPDAVLLFRQGDVYTAYKEDARTCASVLGIDMTEMCIGEGACERSQFPHSYLDAYLPQLIKAGLRVAICDTLVPAA